MCTASIVCKTMTTGNLWDLVDGLLFMIFFSTDLSDSLTLSPTLPAKYCQMFSKTFLYKHSIFLTSDLLIFIYQHHKGNNGGVFSRVFYGLANAALQTGVMIHLTIINCKLYQYGFCTEKSNDSCILLFCTQPHHLGLDVYVYPTVVCKICIVFNYCLLML